MRRVDERAVVGVDKRNHLSDEHMLERRVGHCESASTWPSTSTGSAGRRRRTRLTGGSGAATRAHAGDVAVANYHNEGLGFAFRNQVVQDQTGIPLAAPPVFI